MFASYVHPWSSQKDKTDDITISKLNTNLSSVDSRASSLSGNLQKPFGNCNSTSFLHLFRSGFRNPFPDRTFLLDEITIVIFREVFAQEGRYCGGRRGGGGRRAGFWETISGKYHIGKFFFPRFYILSSLQNKSFIFTSTCGLVYLPFTF